MSEPVTSNPFIIMLINMTVVFAVLIVLGLLINLIHYLDPTKVKEEEEHEEVVVVEEEVIVEEPVSAEPLPDGSVAPEIIAVIAAALASYGYGADQIHAVRPLERDGWKHAAREFSVLHG